jgi:mannan endo-1,4-beta-mannosidase
MLKNNRYRFWRSKKVKELYKKYVKHMLNRINTYSGIAYKDEPAIMIWEIMNEPRYGAWESKNGAEKVRDWLKDAAVFIKSIDKNHLVATGEEGFLNSGDTVKNHTTYPWNAGTGEGSSFVLNADIKEIDLLGFHLWPFQWGLWGSSEQDFGKDMIGEYPELVSFVSEWIDAHWRIAKQVNKPLYLGEFGFQILRRSGSDIKIRNSIMKEVYKSVSDSSLSGLAFWHITASHDVDSVKYKGRIKRKTLLQSQYYDDIIPHDLDFKFDIFCPEDKSTCKIIRDYTAKFSGKNTSYK